MYCDPTINCTATRLKFDAELLSNELKITRTTCSFHFNRAESQRDPSFIKMPIKYNIETFDYSFKLPMRAIFAGSSQSGKTSLITKILKNQRRLFQSNFSVIKYCYPSYLTETPVNIHSFLEQDVNYICGFPSDREVLDLPTNSLLVLDDLAQEALNSELISQLFRVISGKKKYQCHFNNTELFLSG